MAEADEVIDGLAHAVAMVGADRVGPNVPAELALDRDDRAVELGERVEEIPVALVGGRDQERVDPPAVEVANVGGVG